MGATEGKLSTVGRGDEQSDSTDQERDDRSSNGSRANLRKRKAEQTSDYLDGGELFSKRKSRRRSRENEELPTNSSPVSTDQNLATWMTQENIDASPTQLELESSEDQASSSSCSESDEWDERILAFRRSVPTRALRKPNKIEGDEFLVGLPLKSIEKLEERARERRQVKAKEEEARRAAINREQFAAYGPFHIHRDDSKYADVEAKWNMMSISPLHALGTGEVSGAKRVVAEADLGVPIKLGYFSMAEDDIIRKNWEEFVDDNALWDDPPLIWLTKGVTGNALELMGLEKDINELKRDQVKWNIDLKLGKGLPRRSLYSIRERAPSLYHKHGFFTKQDKRRLLSLREDSELSIIDISVIMERDKDVIRETCVFLYYKLAERREKKVVAGPYIFLECDWLELIFMILLKSTDINDFRNRALLAKSLRYIINARIKHPAQVDWDLIALLYSPVTVDVIDLCTYIMTFLAKLRVPNRVRNMNRDRRHWEVARYMPNQLAKACQKKLETLKIRGVTIRKFEKTREEVKLHGDTAIEPNNLMRVFAEEGASAEFTDKEPSVAASTIFAAIGLFDIAARHDPTLGELSVKKRLKALRNCARALRSAPVEGYRPRDPLLIRQVEGNSRDKLLLLKN